VTTPKATGPRDIRWVFTDRLAYLLGDGTEDAATFVALCGLTQPATVPVYGDAESGGVPVGRTGRPVQGGSARVPHHADSVLSPGRSPVEPPEAFPSPRFPKLLATGRPTRRSA
jgi:hypothetical protein